MTQQKYVAQHVTAEYITQLGPEHPIIALLTSIPSLAPRLERDFSSCFWVAYFSEVVRFWLRQQPDWLPSCFATLAQPANKTDFFSRLDRAVAQSKDESDLAQTLRAFRHELMLKIIWRDLVGDADLAEVVTTMSQFADACIRLVIATVQAWMAEKYVVPRAGDGQAMSLIVIALGKLGGSDLNISSDIDIVYTFEKEGGLDGTPFETHSAYFTQLAQRVNRLLSEQTVGGFVFRVDLRLRPFGESGPLVMSIPAMEQYYQEHGRDWERYAMLKARLLTGRVTETTTLRVLLQRFVYRRYIDYTVIVSLREMKAKILRETKLASQAKNIKTGPGGIREIEFIAQAYQLLYGGKQAVLQEPRLLHALRRLADCRLIAGSTARKLSKAYCFLRQVEHRLQSVADQQTHSLPTALEARHCLAISLGFKRWRNFYRRLIRHQRSVQVVFSRLIAGTVEQTSPKLHNDMATVWDSDTCPHIGQALLSKHGLEPAERLFNLLSGFAKQCQAKAISKIATNRLNQLMPHILALVATQDDKAVVLVRMLDLLLSICQRSNYLLLLSENQQSLRHCVRLCAGSAWFSEQLALYPMLLDELIDPTLWLRDVAPKALAQQLTQFLPAQFEQLQQLDLEQAMGHLRRFKQSLVIKIAAAELSRVLPIMKISDWLTSLAVVILQHVVRLAIASLSKQYPELPERAHQAFCVVAYGKLAGYEMSYLSDLDVIFLYDECEQDDHFDIYLRLAQRIIHIMETRTLNGKLYHIDTRLRPSGEAGLMISSFSGFAHYHAEKAWLWEHQALVRSRLVVGRPHHHAQFEQLRRTVLTFPRHRASTQHSVREMRKKMLEQVQLSDELFDLKLSYGGITDIEFIAQLLVMLYARDCPLLLSYSDTIRILTVAGQYELLPVEVAEQLRAIYLCFRAHAHRLALQNAPAIVPRHEVSQEVGVVTDTWERLFCYE